MLDGPPQGYVILLVPLLPLDIRSFVEGAARQVHDAASFGDGDAIGPEIIPTFSLLTPAAWRIF